MRLVYLGTPRASVAPLRALCAAGHDVALVITQPDRKRGRGSALVPSPVKLAATDLGLPVSHDLRDSLNVGASVGVVVAYGALVPADVLSALPMLNLHFSSLPRWRGAAPVERAILAGDVATGVCVMGLEVTLDTGPIFARREVDIEGRYAGELTDHLSDVGAELLTDTLSSPSLPPAVPQVGDATYAKKLSADDFLLAPTETADMLHRRVRLDRAFTWVHGRRLRVIRAHTDPGTTAPGRVVSSNGVVALGVVNGSLVLDVVQSEGGRAVDADAWWSGARLASGVEWGPVEVPRP